jgi:hypothetical protein
VCAGRECGERVVDWTGHYQDRTWLSYNQILNVPNVINITMLSIVYLIMFSPIAILLQLSVWQYMKCIWWANKLKYQVPCYLWLDAPSIKQRVKGKAIPVTGHGGL